jgi:signal transduction histidine kinase
MSTRRGTKIKAKAPRRRAPRRAIPALQSFVNLLKANILFRDVSTAVLQRTRSHFTERHFGPGDLIFDEYSKGRDLFLIASGRVRIKKYTKFGVESLLAVLHPGDFFGELSLIDGLPRSARAEAVDECEVLILSADSYRRMVEEHPQIAMNLLNNLALRLRSMDQNFVMELGRNILASRNRMDRLNMLIEASKIVNSALDLTAVFALILDVATRSVAADRGTVYLVDEKTNELWSLAAQGANMIEIRLPIGKGLAGYVARTGETVNITEAHRDPRFNPEVDLRTGYTTHTVLCMPMRNREGKIIGVFQLLNKKSGYFGPEDESFIEALSVHAAIAVENARMAQEMVSSERLSAVGRMAATIVHDIKGPMATMRLYAGLMKKHSETPESTQMADVITHQVDRLSAMAQEIMEFSEGTSTTVLSRMRLNQALEAVLPFLELDLKLKKLAFNRSFAYPGDALIDADKVARVVANLVSNAADATPEGGTVTIKTYQSADSAVIEVSDTGAGMTEEVKQRLFEPFFTSGKKHGTGLGLSIVKRIVDDHHGRIEVTSTPGAGTTFRIFLPIP